MRIRIFQEDLPLRAKIGECLVLFVGCLGGLFFALLLLVKLAVYLPGHRTEEGVSVWEESFRVVQGADLPKKYRSGISNDELVLVEIASPDDERKIIKERRTTIFSGRDPFWVELEQGWSRNPDLLVYFGVRTWTEHYPPFLDVSLRGTDWNTSAIIGDKPLMARYIGVWNAIPPTETEEGFRSPPPFSSA